MTTDPGAAGAPTRHGGDGRIAVQVDHDLCSGARTCQQRYAEVFVVEGGKSWIRPGIDWADVDIERLVDVESECPWSAVTVERT